MEPSVRIAVKHAGVRMERRATLVAVAVLARPVGKGTAANILVRITSSEMVAQGSVFAAMERPVTPSRVTATVLPAGWETTATWSARMVCNSITFIYAHPRS